MPKSLMREKNKSLFIKSRDAGCIATVATALLFQSGPSLALDVDAGDYTALPPGTDLAAIYYQPVTRDELYADGDKAPINAGLDSHIGLARYIHFMEIGGYTVDPQVILPFGKLDGKDDTSFLGDASGIGDVILAATVWLVNKPETSTYFGITPFVIAPTGSYDNEDALNVGENRWQYLLQAGYITELMPNLLVDLVADVTVYGENDEFGAAKDTLDQDPSYQLQGFLRYQVNPRLDLRTGLSHVFGGETEINGVSQDNELEITKMTVGAAFMATPTLQLKASYGTDLAVENGFSEQHRLNLRVLKVF